MRGDRKRDVYSTDSKDYLPQVIEGRLSSTSRSYKYLRWGFLLILSVVCLCRLSLLSNHQNVALKKQSDTAVEETEPACPQAPLIRPSKHASHLKELDELFSKDDFRRSAYESLGAAVRVPLVMVLLRFKLILTFLSVAR